MSPVRRRLHRPGSSGGAEERVKRATRTHPLVLVQGDGSRRLYWQQQWRRETNWAGKTAIWDMLWALAGAAQRGQSVASDELTRSSPDAFVDRRSRLRKFLPQDLDAMIVRVPGESAYRLEIDPRQVKLIQLESGQGFLEPDDENRAPRP
jgi:hypothetical protein